MAPGGRPDRVQVDRDILPIFLAPRKEPCEPVSFQGTGFIIARNVLVTCWHIVSSSPPDDHEYAAIIEIQPGSYKAFFLNNLEQDANGSDLATANIGLGPVLGLTLGRNSLALGTDVCTFGYPLTDLRQRPGGGRQFVLNPRYLQGYVTRKFHYEHRLFGSVPSYELDMLTPLGLSGAPVIKVNTKEVFGVVYGSHDVATIEEVARIDPETGKREPEVQRLVSFSLAHYTETLRNLRSTATRGLSLADFLARQ